MTQNNRERRPARDDGRPATFLEAFAQSCARASARSPGATLLAALALFALAAYFAAQNFNVTSDKWFGEDARRAFVVAETGAKARGELSTIANDLADRLAASPTFTVASVGFDAETIANKRLQFCTTSKLGEAARDASAARALARGDGSAISSRALIARLARDAETNVDGAREAIDAFATSFDVATSDAASYFEEIPSPVAPFEFDSGEARRFRVAEKAPLAIVEFEVAASANEFEARRELDAILAEAREKYRGAVLTASGAFVLSGQERLATLEALRTLGLGAVVGSLVIFWLCFGSFLRALAGTATLVVATTWTLGEVALECGGLSSGNASALVAIFLFDAAIVAVYLARYSHFRARNLAVADACARAAVRTAAAATIGAALFNAAGMTILILNESTRALATTLGRGSIVGWFALFLLTPACLRIADRARGRDDSPRETAFGSELSRASRRVLLALSAIALLASAGGISRIDREPSRATFVDERGAASQALARATDALGFNPLTSAKATAATLDDLRTIKARLGEDSSLAFDDPWSAAPRATPDREARLTDVRDAFAQFDPESYAPSVDGTIEYADLRARIIDLREVASDDASRTLTRALERLDAAAPNEQTSRLRRFETLVAEKSLARLATLRAASDVEPTSPENLSEGSRARYSDEQGAAYGMRIYTTKDATSGVVLKAFAGNLRAAVEGLGAASGGALTRADEPRAERTAFGAAFATTALCAFLFACLAAQSFRFGTIALLFVAIGFGTAFGFAGYARPEATLYALSLALAYFVVLCVLATFLLERREEDGEIRASSGFATSCVSALLFSTLFFLTADGWNQLGRFGAIMSAGLAFATLIVAPALADRYERSAPSDDDPAPETIAETKDDQEETNEEERDG